MTIGMEDQFGDPLDCERRRSVKRGERRYQPAGYIMV